MHRVMPMSMVVCLVLCVAASALLLSASSQEANSREWTVVAQRDELERHRSAAVVSERDQATREQDPKANGMVQREGLPEAAYLDNSILSTIWNIRL